MVVALQRGIPLCARPFEELSRELGCGEADLLACLARQRAMGTVRRFGAVFDTRRLGYRSALCAAAVSVEALDAVAAKLTPLVGVTHCYVREATSALRPGVPNLWFTLSYPADIFPAMVDEVAARLGPYALHVLPATRRYKVDVVFGAATRAREEDVAEGDDLPPVTARDRAVIGALQGDTEARADFFAALAGRLGMKEWDLLSTLEIWRRKGRLKRIGLLLHHRNAGWSANGMCCWRVAGDTTAAGGGGGGRRGGGPRARGARRGDALLRTARGAELPLQPLRDGPRSRGGGGERAVRVPFRRGQPGGRRRRARRDAPFHARVQENVHDVLCVILQLRDGGESGKLLSRSAR